MENATVLESKATILQESAVDILPGYLALTCMGVTILFALASYGGYLVYRNRVIIRNNNNDENNVVHNVVYEDF